jgi:iron complex outermembrane recepter protein
MGGARVTATSRNRLFGMLLTSAASVTVLATMPAIAQSASTGDQAAAPAGGLEEIVVTARKRSEDIQKTPVSITALSADQIAQENIRDISNLRGLVPNLEITPESNYGRAANSLTIRGIGQTSLVANVDPGVGFYMNDLYIARPEGQLLGFYDLASVQVLKGPQGTLFGKNTIGGAILLDTQLPKDTFGGYAIFRYGEYNRIESEGALNIPINDKISTRISFATSDVDGYIRDKLDDGTKDDQHEKSVRLQIRLKPIDDLTIDLLAEYNHHKDDGSAAVVTGCSDTQYASNNYNGSYAHDNNLPTFCHQYPVLDQQYTVYGTPHAADPTGCLPGGYRAGNCIAYFGNEAAFTKVEADTVNLRMNYQIDENLNVKSVTGFRRSFLNDLGGEYDDGGTPVALYAEEDNTTTEQWSEEVNLNGNYWDGRLTFVVGAVYVDQTSGFAQNTGPDFDGDATGYSFLDSEDFESDAVYAQATYKITDDLEFTAGGRYSYDHKKVESVLWNALGTPTYEKSGEVSANYVCYFKNEYPSCPSYDGGKSGYENGAGGYYLPGPGINNSNGRQYGSSSYYDFDPRGQLSYQFTPDIFGYVSVTGGYQSGGFNTQLGPGIGPTNGITPYGKERVWDYEGGFKTQWLENRLRVNATGFYQQFNNIQATVTNPFLQIPTREIVNAAAAHEDGVELEVEALPTPDWVIRANGAYLDQAYDTLSPQIDANNALLEKEGKAPELRLQDPLTSAPKFTASVSTDYTYHLPWEATLVGDLTYKWVDTRIYGINERFLLPGATNILSESSPYYTIDGRLSYVSPDGRYSVTLWGTNLTGKYYSTNTCSNYCLGLGVSTYYPGRPREVGFELKYNFDSGEAPEETPATPYTPPAPVAVAAPKSYLVFFDFNKSDLTAQATTIVDQAAKNAAPMKVTQLTVTGHTDTVGSDAYNMRLSRRRAESVAAQLEKDGIPSSEIAIVAKGKRDLLVPTADGVKEPQNRRVQIVYDGGPTS